LYTVADQSSPEIQRRYLAQAIADRIPGFADVEYPDWRGLLSRLAREARSAGWRGPIIFDEFPYWVRSSPELPSVVQRWIDHEAREAHLVVAIAGSSQRMMQGLVLDKQAPLFGRAQELLGLDGLEPTCLKEVFTGFNDTETIEAYAAWGGIPRYWELASELVGDTTSRIEELVLDPLDAIGAGAHRVSEIAGRIGRPATSLWRPLDRLIGMGLVRRDTPFGESERGSRRSLYRIDDPFFRLWFRVVAPHRGRLAQTTKRDRQALLGKHWNGLLAQAWEDLCRQRIPRMHPATPLRRCAPWGPAVRWWRGTLPEWDVVCASDAGELLLLGEAKWQSKPIGERDLERALTELMARPLPELQPAMRKREVVRALFVPALEGNIPTRISMPMIVTASDLLRSGS
jgi:AAA+ ATPase superfamily predicted ATPase